MHPCIAYHPGAATTQIMLLCSLISLIAGASLGALILSRFLKARLNSDTKEALRRSRDLQKTQEQLTITNEELQTSKEEMESAIEELSILNEDLRTRNQKLKDLNDQLTRIKDIHSQIIEAAPAAIFTIDHDLQLLSLNSACRQLAVWTGGKRGAGNSLSAIFDARFLYDTGFLKNIE